MKKKKLLFFILATLLCLGLGTSSCSEGDFTIFYQVVNEKAIQDTNLENTLSLHAMTRMNLGSGDRYYIAANDIFTRSVGSNNWDHVSSTTNNGEVMCNSMVEFGGDLYAAFYSRDGKDFGLYYITNANLDADPRHITWVEETVDADVANLQVGNFKIVNGNLFMSVKNGGLYSYAYYNGANYSLVSFDGSTTLSSPIRDVGFLGGNYWYISGDKIYQAGGISPVTEYVAGPTVSGSERFEGIIGTDDNQIYVSTSEGMIWLYSGGSWSSDNFEYINSVGQKEDVWFTKFIEVPDTVDLVVVGSRGSGFYEIDEDQGLGDIERFDNTSKRELYAGAVENFYVDAANDNFFVLTIGTGLWRSKRDNGEWDSWTWE